MSIYGILDIGGGGIGGEGGTGSGSCQPYSHCQNAHSLCPLCDTIQFSLADGQKVKHISASPPASSLRSSIGNLDRICRGAPPPPVLAYMCAQPAQLGSGAHRGETMMLARALRATI